MQSFARVTHPFQGNPFDGQMILRPGTILAIDKHTNGWTHGHAADNPTERGWFPSSYVQPIQEGFHPQTQSYSQHPLGGNTVLNHNNDNSGFGGAVLGGEWNGSETSRNSGGKAFLLDPSSQNQITTQSTESNRTRIGSSEAHLHKNRPFGIVGKAFKKAASKTGSAVSGAASKTGSTLSNAAFRTRSAVSGVTSKATSASAATFDETGHRMNEMRSQREDIMARNATTYTSPPVQNMQGETVHETTVTKVPGGIIPGSRIDRTTTTNTTAYGEKVTTVKTKRKANGGFFPGIPGKTETIETTRVGPRGQVSHHTETRSGGGFYIIPLGPVGLVAAGALAAKHAHDSKHKD